MPTEAAARSLRGWGVPAVAFPDYMPTPENFEKVTNEVYNMILTVMKNSNRTKADLAALHKKIEEEINKGLNM